MPWLKRALAAFRQARNRLAVAEIEQELGLATAATGDAAGAAVHLRAAREAFLALGLPRRAAEVPDPPRPGS
jgi:hypothetical protein